MVSLSSSSISLETRMPKSIGERTVEKAASKRSYFRKFVVIGCVFVLAAVVTYFHSDSNRQEDYDTSEKTINLPNLHTKDNEYLLEEKSMMLDLGGGAVAAGAVAAGGGAAGGEQQHIVAALENLEQTSAGTGSDDCSSFFERCKILASTYFPFFSCLFGVAVSTFSIVALYGYHDGTSCKYVFFIIFPINLGCALGAFCCQWKTASALDAVPDHENSSCCRVSERFCAVLVVIFNFGISSMGFVCYLLKRDGKKKMYPRHGKKISSCVAYYSGRNLEYCCCNLDYKRSVTSEDNKIQETFEAEVSYRNYES